MTTTTDLARRNGGAPAPATSSAVAIRSGQAEFDDKQKAALVAMGVSEKATRAELAVFFHQCQKLRLDPFQKQIYFIHRRTREGDKWVEKPTTQIGIDGFRVTRDRIADEKGLRVEYEDTIWYGSDGQAYDVWLWDEPPTACKFVVVVDGRRFPSVLRFNEYCQFGREDANGVRPRTGRWRDGHAHQIEKCAEADALRRAFPNDLSGAILTDAAPLDDPEAPPPAPPRATGEEIRNRPRHPRQVKAEVVDVAPEDAPWPGDAAPAAPAQVQPIEPGDPRDAVIAELDRLGIVSYGPQGDVMTALAQRAVSSAEELTAEEAAGIATRLAACKNRAQLDALLATGEAGGE